MQSLTIIAAAGAISLFATTGAWAQGGFQGQAKLATAVATPFQAKVKGVTWSCDGALCIGEARYYNSSDGSLTECKQVAAALGTLVSYEARGREVTGGTLRLCNTAASTQLAGAPAASAK